LGVLNMPHSTFPRIRHFSSEKMKSMVLADSLGRPDDTNDSEFGKTQVSYDVLVSEVQFIV